MLHEPQAQMPQGQNFSLDPSTPWSHVPENLFNLSKPWMGLLGGSDGKESACNAGDLSWIPGLGTFPGGGNGNPTPIFWPGEFHKQESGGLYSPWGCKELDTTEQLNTFKPHIAHLQTEARNIISLGCVGVDGSVLLTRLSLASHFTLETLPDAPPLLHSSPGSLPSPRTLRLL